MANVLYPDFLDQEDQYLAAEQFWNSLFHDLSSELGQGDEWKPWRPRTYANGLPFERDGNPIFDARSVRLPRAVQIIQWPPESDGVEISAWISELAVDNVEEYGTLQELTINCSLSLESAELAKALLRRWLELVTVDEMHSFIAATVPEEDHA